MVHQSTLLWIGLHQIDASGLAGEPHTSVSLSSTRRRPGEALSSLARTSEYDLRASSRLSCAPYASPRTSRLAASSASPSTCRAYSAFPAPISTPPHPSSQP